MSKRGLVIDADYLIFQSTQDKITTNSMFSQEDGLSEPEEYNKSLKPYKNKFKRELQLLIDDVSLNMIGEMSGKVKVCFSDPNGNFRYKLYPEYKDNRKASNRSKLFYRLRKWAHKKYGYVKNLEADDVVAHYVRKGWVGASFDKDLLKGVHGTWFDVYHSRRYIIETTEEQANHFVLLQSLAGDPTDNIKGLPGVGMKTAEKLLIANGSTWEGVVKAYKDAGYTEADAVLTRRLVDMGQWNGKRIKLFT